ncbi:MAG: glycosyltransferase [Anaerolineaceae bacterium]
MNFQNVTQTKIRVVFLIRSLFFGGAERQLLTLLGGMNKEIFEPVVLCYYRGGELEPDFLNAGIRVISLEKTGRWDIFPFIIRLLRQVSAIKPDILHGYLPMSNLLVVLVHLFFPGIKIIFGVRSSFLDMSKYDLITRLVYRLEILVSRFPDLTIVNSFTSKKIQVINGFPEKNIIVVHNGIDTSRFYQSSEERNDFRSHLGMDSETTLIGLIGRLDPVKGHPTFLQAAARVVEENNKAKFIVIGDGDRQYQKELVKIVNDLRLSEKVIWLEGQKNVRAVYNSLDICCSASIGESFSNVIAEAMSCCVPCVVTDVGDSAIIVGEFGEVVPAGDAIAMAEGMKRVLSFSASDRMLLGANSRRRIEENFSKEQMIRRTETTLINLHKGKIEE